MKLTELESAAEAVLFAAGEAIEPSAVAAALGVDEKTARAIVVSLADKYAAENRGVQIAEINGAFQMRTNAAFYDNVAALFAGSRKRALTQPLYETLAIIAYSQPVTRMQIEEIRGVDARNAVNRLVEYGLACEVGRLDAPGRPILFGTTDEFLRRFGVTALEVPPELTNPS